MAEIEGDFVSARQAHLDVAARLFQDAVALAGTRNEEDGGAAGILQTFSL